MRNRTAFVTLLAAIGIVLAGCTTAPEPALSSSGPKLDPEAIAYDNLDFNISRDRIYESCKSLPAEFASEAGLKAKPYEGYGGSCVFAEQWGRLNIDQPAQQEREDAKVFFESYWLGDKFLDKGYFQRGILLDRYYSITQTYNPYGTCDVAVDTGSETALVITAGPPSDQSSQTFDSGQSYPVTTILEQYCSRAKQAAEKFLLLLDPQGGSRKVS